MAGSRDQHRRPDFDTLQDASRALSALNERGSLLALHSLGEAGRAQLAQLATTLLQITGEIPAEINWILRVDGHTDAIPINTPRFPSNWELSTARAVSVVTFLIDRGIPEVRLAATGFGEFQPLDTGESEVSLARNRRIELKLTER